MALEGIGPIGSVLLYATLGTGEAFANGRQFSAYLGLTPKQFSSGGKVNLVEISPDMTAVPELAEEYARLLPHFLHEEPFEEGTRRALERLRAVRPDLVDPHALSGGASRSR